MLLLPLRYHQFAAAGDGEVTGGNVQESFYEKEKEEECQGAEKEERGRRWAFGGRGGRREDHRWRGDGGGECRERIVIRVAGGEVAVCGGFGDGQGDVGPLLWGGVLAESVSERELSLRVVPMAFGFSIPRN